MPLSPSNHSQKTLKDHTSLSSSANTTRNLETNGQRLDIFLFRSRLLKTRALAARTIRSGRVRLSRYGQTDRVLKPHAKVKKGDIITFMRDQTLINIEVIDHPYRRGPAKEAQSCYRSASHIESPLENSLESHMRHHA